MGTKKGWTRESKQRLEDEADVIAIAVGAVGPIGTAMRLTVRQAQDAMMGSPDWRYPILRCRGCDVLARQVMAEGAWRGRRLLYCVRCKQVDVWV